MLCMLFFFNFVLEIVMILGVFLIVVIKFFSNDRFLGKLCIFKWSIENLFFFLVF